MPNRHDSSRAKTRHRPTFRAAAEWFVSAHLETPLILSVQHRVTPRGEVIAPRQEASPPLQGLIDQREGIEWGEVRAHAHDHHGGAVEAVVAAAPGTLGIGHNAVDCGFQIGLRAALAIHFANATRRSRSGAFIASPRLPVTSRASGGTSSRFAIGSPR